jgi:hypothetical protein
MPSVLKDQPSAPPMTMAAEALDAKNIPAASTASTEILVNLIV